MDDLKEWLEKRMEEFAKETGLRIMTDEEREEHKAKQKKKFVTGKVTFLKGESVRKAAEWLKKKS